MPETVEVTFQAQEWFDDLARPAERSPNSVTFTVPYEDAVTEEGDLPDDDSHESDELAFHENAPDWVNEWADEGRGPFYIQTEIIE